MANIDSIRQSLTGLIRDKLNEEKDNNDIIHYGGRVFGTEEILAAIDAVLDLWLTHNKNANSFEKEFGNYLGMPLCISCNSGSSANLIIISSLKSQNYSGRIPDNSLIATPALTFPTTVSPLYYNNLVPLYIDIEPDTLNMDFDSLYRMSKIHRVEAVLLPHIMGNTTNMDLLLDFCRSRKILLIEDCCEAMGTTHDGKYLGTYGAAGSFSMYASHHITSGEGGIIVTSDEELHDIMVSIRDWGRVYPVSGANPIINNHDLRYTYTESGFNLKQNDIFAAIGRVQLNKLNLFNELRKLNFNKFYQFFQGHGSLFIHPRSYKNTYPAWFGYPIILNKDAPFTIVELKTHLEENRIETRSLFSGNITLQPGFRNRPFLGDNLFNTDYLMNNSIFIGVYPGITDNDINYIISTIEDFIKRYSHV